MQTPESKVKERLFKHIKELQAAGVPIVYEAREAGGYTYKKGKPDFWIAYYGKHIEFEVKAPGGSMSTMQYKWRDINKAMQVPCYCIESVKEFDEALKENYPG